MKKAFTHFCIYPLLLTQEPPIPNTVAPPTTWQRRNTQNQHTSLPHYMHAKEEQITGIYQLPYGNIARHSLRPRIRNPPPPTRPPCRSPFCGSLNREISKHPPLFYPQFFFISLLYLCLTTMTPFFK